jgi:HEPN domain-containing protein
MSPILDIQERISQLYKMAHEPSAKVPLSVQALEWLAFARMYAEAATLVAEHAEHLWLPRLQLTGQAVELALKACLAASESQPPVDHDLVKLYVLIAKQGYLLSEFEQAAIVHLAHFYHRDLATKTRFKARYPAPTTEQLGGAVPDDATYSQLIRSLCTQAEGAVNRLFAQHAHQEESGDA